MLEFFGQRPLGRSLVGILLFVIGLACAAFLAYFLFQDLSLWVFGRRTLAEVVDLKVEQIGDFDEGELTFRYFVEYRFTTPGGQTITSISPADVREWGALQIGGPAAVVYFPLYPAHNRLDESRFVSILACAYLPLVMVSWICLGLGWYLFQPARSRVWWFGDREPQQAASEGEDKES